MKYKDTHPILKRRTYPEITADHLKELTSIRTQTDPELPVIVWYNLTSASPLAQHPAYLPHRQLKQISRQDNQQGLSTRVIFK
jgi:hypothetical protein